MTLVGLLLVSTIIFFSTSKIVQVQVVSRHCDRTTISSVSFPNFPSVNIFEKTNQTIGELTNLGIRQCSKLGEEIRGRYLSEDGVNRIEGIREVYNVDDYWFESTAIGRSLRSVYAIALGMFPAYGGYEVDVSPYGFPVDSGVQVIPIHSMKQENDIFMLGYQESKCKIIWDNLRNYYLSDDGRKMVQDNNDTLQAIGKVAGITDQSLLSLDNIYLLWDTFNVYKSHDILPSALQGSYDYIKNISDQCFYKDFGKQNLGGGKLVEKLIENMNTFIESNKVVRRRRRRGIEVEKGVRRFILDTDYELRNLQHQNEETTYEEQEFKRYRHFACHDTSLGNLFSALQLNDDYPELRGIPPYGSAIAFELHTDDDTEYYIKIFFKNGFDGDFEEYKMISLGSQVCKDGCTFTKFKEIAEGGAIPQYCTECNNEVTDVCLQEKVIADLLAERDVDYSTITGLSVSVGTFVFFTIILSTVLLVIFFCSDFFCDKVIKPVKNKLAGKLNSEDKTKDHKLLSETLIN